MDRTSPIAVDCVAERKQEGRYTRARAVTLKLRKKDVDALE